MKVPRWAKTLTYVVVDTLLLGTAGAVTAFNHTNESAKKNLQTALAAVTPQDAGARLAAQETDTATKNRIRNDMDIHAALLFYCDSQISYKIAGLKSADGPELIQEKPDYFIVWQADEKKYDTLEKVLVGIDPDTKMQFCMTYDAKHNDLAVHDGGTNFGNAKDVFNAGVSSNGGISPRAEAGARYMRNGLKEFRKDHPEIDPKTIHTSIFAHSAGVTTILTEEMVAMSEGFDVNTIDILDGFGGKAVFAATAEATGIPEAVLEKNVTSISACKPGVLNYFTQATATVGAKQVCGAEGHKGKEFVVSYNKERATATLTLKKP